MSLPNEPAQGPATSGRTGPAHVPHNTVRDTWRWLWPDTAFRLLPFGVATLAYAHFWGGGAAGSGGDRSRFFRFRPSAPTVRVSGWRMARRKN